MTQYQSRVPELLAPAGGPEALRAAVNNGADAVYLGIDRLNARRSAENFTLETLGEATRFAHLKGSRVYLTANVLILPDEMADALHVVASAWAAGVDAVIVQDIGLMRALQSELPEVRIHASTQINTHNSLTVAQLERFGASRVTLARETSVSEAEKLCAGAATAEIEVFVHGALCMCYSGQCLLSSLIGRRSANRGMCAQPCRLPYELLDMRGRVIETPGAHLLSPRDLCGIDMLPRLIKSGVSALKIEGRMKDPSYVALVTGVYRAALDRALFDPDDYEVTPAEHSILSEAFSRGFTPAYLDDIRDNRMMSYSRPNNRGVPVGRVSHVEGREIKVAIDIPLDGDDTIEIWTSRGRFAQRVGEMRLPDGSRPAVAPAGSTVRMIAEKQVSPGDRVFRVVNAALMRAARRTYEDEKGPRPLEVDLSVHMVQGEPLVVEARHGDSVGRGVGPVVEEARTKAVTTEEIAEHVGRLGGTLFEPASWDIELQPGVGIGFSALHRARRDALQALEASLLQPWADREVRTPDVPRVRRDTSGRPPAPELVVWTTDIVTARACIGAGANRVIMPHWALQEIPAEEVPASVSPELPRIAHDREVADLLALAAEAKGRTGDVSRLVVGNLGLIAPVSREAGSTDAHWSLNAVNALACAALAETGASFVWLSPELSGRQIAQITSESPVPVGIAVYGRQEVMVTEHCVLMSMGECSQVCGTCPRRRTWHALRDRKGYSFPVSSDPLGRSHIYNSVPLDLTRAAGEIVSAGVSAVRLDFTVEHSQEAQKITRIVREAFAAAVGDREIEEAPVTQSTSGHFFRGVS